MRMGMENDYEHSIDYQIQRWTSYRYECHVFHVMTLRKDAHYSRDTEGYASQVVQYQLNEDPSKFGIWPGAASTVGSEVFVYW
jgi:hypothetical protein